MRFDRSDRKIFTVWPINFYAQTVKFDRSPIEIEYLSIYYDYKERGIPYLLASKQVENVLKLFAKHEHLFAYCAFLREK